MVYIDFDGVVVDTWPEIEKIYKKEYNTSLIEEAKLRKLFEKLDWEQILNISKKNYNNISVLKKLKDFNIKILSKVNTESERIAKVCFVENNIGMDIITVPIDKEKYQFDFVSAV